MDIKAGNGVTLLYIPIGIPGAGKTTLGHQMVADGIIPKGSVISVDHYRLLLTGDIMPTQSHVEMDVCYMFAKLRISKHLPVYFDATNVSNRAILTLAGMTNDLLFIVFNVPLKTCFRQNAKRDKRIPDPVLRGMYSSYKRIVKVLEDGNYPIRYIIGREERASID